MEKFDQLAQRCAVLTSQDARLAELARFLREEAGADAVMLSWRGAEETEERIVADISASLEQQNTETFSFPKLHLNGTGVLYAGKRVELPLVLSERQASQELRATQEPRALLWERCKEFDLKTVCLIPIQLFGNEQRGNGVVCYGYQKTQRNFYPWELKHLIAHVSVATQASIVQISTPEIPGKAVPRALEAITPTESSELIQLQEQLKEDPIINITSQPDTAPAISVSEVPQSSDVTAEEDPETSDFKAPIVSFRTDRHFQLKNVSGDIETLFGVKPDDLLKREFAWEDFISLRDLAKLRSRAEKRARERKSFEYTLKIKEVSGARWFQLCLQPRYDKQEVFKGWDGLDIESTARRQAELELLAERRRLRALFDVSSSLHGHLDMQILALKGLHALIRATRAQKGFVVLNSGESNSLEIVASEGLSKMFLDRLAEVLPGPSIISEVMQSGKPFVSQDLQQDPRARHRLASQERIRSLLVVPIEVQNVVVGAFGLLHARGSRFNETDIELATTAVRSIGLAIAQAELYVRERRQASALSALYQLSHELSKQLTLREVAEQSFTVIRGELNCKRGWFGMLNEQGTHIVGLAGFGAGVTKAIIDKQLELKLRHDFIDVAIRTKEPVYVPNGTPMECSGLNRIVEILKPESIVIIPLVALGQIVGLVLLEPENAAVKAYEVKRDLLRSIAAEIGTVLLARRFETRLAEAGKMRMAGMLAAGVAHNFNNLLQAVMGQASLIEMQVPKDSSVLSSTKMIIEAAHRGAQLVKQLLHFSTEGSKSIRDFSMKQMLLESESLYRSLLPANIKFSVRTGDRDAVVTADYGKIQQVISNLVVNAREAVSHGDQPEIIISQEVVTLLTGEVSPDLAPGEYVRIDVDDNGLGMSPDEQARCFEPFFTTKSPDSKSGVSFGGVGLSLSTGYSILKNHKGVITVSSSKGEGTVFSLYIPLTPKHDAQIDEIVDAPQSRFVLLCNLEPSLAFALQTSLRSLGILSAVVNLGTRAVSEIIKDLRAELVDDSAGLMVVDIERAQDHLNEALELTQKGSWQFETLLYQKSQGNSLELENEIDNTWFTLPKANVVDAPLDVWKIANSIKSNRA